MDEGTVFIVLEFPHVWPVADDILLLSTVQGDTTISSRALRSGSLQIRVDEQSSTRVNYVTQPIEVSGPGVSLLEIQWNKDDVSVHINGTLLLSEASANGHSIKVRTGSSNAGDCKSTSSTDARTACADWMAWRRDRYSTPTPSGWPNRRMKTFEEVVSELSNARLALSDLFTLISQGRNYLLGHLATELRALVYWSSKKAKAYKPLLLRVAGRLDLPLPIFALPDGDTPEIVSEAAMHYRSGVPTTLQRFEKQKLIDLQEWLDSRILDAELVRQFPTESSERGALTANSVILEVASTLGAAHYDEDVPVLVEALFDLQGEVANETTVFLLKTTEVVIALCAFVLQSYQDAKYDDSWD